MIFFASPLNTATFSQTHHTVQTLLQAAAQFLLDDWAPDSPEWYDESTGTWHYDPYDQDEDRITGLKDIQGSDMVSQCLSDAQGVMPHCLCRSCDSTCCRHAQLTLPATGHSTAFWQHQVS